MENLLKHWTKVHAEMPGEYDVPLNHVRFNKINFFSIF